TTMRNTAYLKYGAAASDAAHAYIDDPTSQVWTYKGDRQRHPATKLQSKTYNFTGFGKTDEIGDYVQNFKTDGTTIRNTAYLKYRSEERRAGNADIDDPNSQVWTYKDDHQSNTATKL